MTAIEPDEIIEPDGKVIKAKKIEPNRFKRFIKRNFIGLGNYLLYKIENKILEKINVNQDRFD